MTNRLLACFMKSVGLIVLVLQWDLMTARGASISWGTPFSITSTSDLNTAGTLIEAVDFTDAGQSSDRIVNTSSGTITFVPRYGNDASLSGANFPYSDSFDGSAPRFWNNSTGDAGLDDVLNGQVFTGADGVTSLVTVNLSGLSMGATYLLQVIGPADDRSCCTARTLQADDSTDPNAPGNLSAVMMRGNAPSVTGTFVADATTQSFSIRGADPVPNDPAIGGYLLRQIPEPGCTVLSVLAAATVVLMRRKP